jgi:hypothetical protein
MSEGPLSVLDVDMAGKVRGCVVVEESSCANVRLKVRDAPSRLYSDKYTPGVRCLKAAALGVSRRYFQFTFAFSLMRTLQRPAETALIV